MTYKNYYSKIILSSLIFLGLSLISIKADAIGSGKKSAEEKSRDNEKKATASYNNGVTHMDQATAIIQKGDSAYAFNYRATSDAKAKKEYEKAIGQFKDAIEYKPDMKEAYNNLGFCYRKMGQLENSLRAYKNALNLDKDFARAREYLGETYLALGELENAQKELDYLRNLKSAYADTLAQSIEIYKLNNFNEYLQNTK